MLFGPKTLKSTTIEGQAFSQPRWINCDDSHTRTNRFGINPYIAFLCETSVTQTITNAKPYEADLDPDSPNRNLTPLTTALDADDRLVVGGCLLSDLAQRYGTPLYVLDEQTLRGTCRAYRDALKRHYPGPSLPIYASKANSSLVMSSLVASEDSAWMRCPPESCSPRFAAECLAIGWCCTATTSPMKNYFLPTTTT